jgi:6-phosphogluconate dehydrogenase (decarboxylating)
MRTILNRGSNVSLTSGADTRVDWDEEVQDDGNWHSTSTNTSRITVDRKGIYFVELWASFTAAGGTSRGVMLYKNGTEFLWTKGSVTADNTIDGSKVLTHLIELGTGDYVEMYVVAHASSINLLAGGSFPYTSGFALTLIGEVV